jgi:hypothetical protein
VSEEPCDECNQIKNQVIFVSVGIGVLMGAGLIVLIRRGR